MSFNIILKPQIERLIQKIKNSLDDKQNILSAGDGISLSNDEISVKLSSGLEFENQNIIIDSSRVALIQYVKDVVKPGNYLALSKYIKTIGNFTYMTNGNTFSFNGIVPAEGYSRSLSKTLHLLAGTYVILTNSINTPHVLSMNSVYLSIIINKTGSTAQTIYVVDSEYNLVLDSSAEVEVFANAVGNYDFSVYQGIFDISCTRVFGSSNIPDSAALITPTEFNNLD